MNQAHEILNAAKAGDAYRVHTLLAADPGLARCRGDRNRTPLHYAALNGYTAVAALLLHYGAPPTARETDGGTTPLHWAAGHGHREVARLLIDRGADLNALENLHRCTPLAWASVLGPGHVGAAELLLAHGARLDVFSAVALNKADALRAMIAASYERALFSPYLLSFGKARAVRSMVRSDPNTLSARMSLLDDARQPLHLAVLKNRTDMVRLLLECGADVKAQTASGRTALCIAAEANMPEMAALLLAWGAPVDPQAAVALGKLDPAQLLKTERFTVPLSSVRTRRIAPFSIPGELRSPAECRRAPDAVIP